MTVLVVGSVALDSIETPFGAVDEAIGGSAVYFAASASHLTHVQVVGVTGDDYPLARLDPLVKRGVDFSGLERAKGPSFRWRGRYRHDLNSAETLDTQLGVFSTFQPRIPEAFRSTPFLFLGNIDPQLQLDVLSQIKRPRLVACDTMNFWIDSRRAELLQLLAKVDILMLNDAEARQLSGKPNLLKAAAWLHQNGPRYIVIKKGEHGALLFTPGFMFFVPAFPLEDVFDPTGAGDSFAGGFIGSLAREGELSEDSLRRAVVYGSAMGSFAVEKFSIDGLLGISLGDISERVRDFHRMVSFEQELK
jgi:sugar/nucleoside kinase (ribokinase family)